MKKLTELIAVYYSGSKTKLYIGKNVFQAGFETTIKDAGASPKQRLVKINFKARPQELLKNVSLRRFVYVIVTSLQKDIANLGGQSDI